MATIKPQTYSCPLCPTEPWPWDYEDRQTGIRVRKGNPGRPKFLGTFTRAKAHFLAVHGAEAAREYGFLDEGGHEAV